MNIRKAIIDDLSRVAEIYPFALHPLWGGWQKFIPFRLLGSSPSPRQSAGATLTEHHIIVVATLRL